MEIGKTYLVTIDDCCVWGEFTSKLIDINEDENYIFENGVRIGGYKIANEAEEIKED
jgi:hypothetical protein